MSLSQIAEILSDWAQRMDFVERVWVYGSRVPGSRRPARPDSDLDVAIDLRSTIRQSGYARFLCEHDSWGIELSGVLPFRVHVTHYNDLVDPDLPVEEGNVKKEVDRYGYLVYQKAIADTAKPT